MGQNGPELFVSMSLIIAKMFTISSYFWTTESRYFWLHSVGSPALPSNFGANLPTLLHWHSKTYWNITIHTDSIKVPMISLHCVKIR